MEKPFIGRRFGCCQCSQTKTVMSCVIYLEQRTNYVFLHLPVLVDPQAWGSPGGTLAAAALWMGSARN